MMILILILGIASLYLFFHFDRKRKNRVSRYRDKKLGSYQDLLNRIRKEDEETDNESKKNTEI